MKFFSYVEVYIYSYYNLESLNYNLIFIYLPWFSIDYKQVLKITDYLYHIDVIWKITSHKFSFRYSKSELWKAHFLDDLMKPQYAPGSEGIKWHLAGLIAPMMMYVDEAVNTLSK